MEKQLLIGGNPDLKKYYSGKTIHITSAEYMKEILKAHLKQIGDLNEIYEKKLDCDTFIMENIEMVSMSDIANKEFNRLYLALALQNKKIILTSKRDIKIYDNMEKIML